MNSEFSEKREETVVPEKNGVEDNKVSESDVQKRVKSKDAVLIDRLMIGFIALVTIACLVLGLCFMDKIRF